MAQLASVMGYAVVVAFTTLPVLAVIAVLLDTGKAARGWQLTAGYAGALAALFLAASFGLAQLSVPRLARPGLVEIVAGLLLLLIAAGVWVWRRHRGGRGQIHTGHHEHSMQRLTARRAVLVGVQFGVHPENLALTFAAATHVADGSDLERVLATALFTAVGISTVAVPTAAFGVAGDRVRDRLDRLRRAIVARSFLLTEVLIALCGLVLLGFGVVTVSRS